MKNYDYTIVLRTFSMIIGIVLFAFSDNMNAFSQTLPATVVDIVVNSDDHNTLEAAVIAAGLVETLQGEGPFTVFAPTDAAFAALPEGTVDALLADIPALTSILTYHVVGAKALSTDLSDGQMIATVNGKEIKVTINNDGVFINDAKVTVADIEAGNGVVHVIDAVLLPPADIRVMEDDTYGKLMTDHAGNTLYFFSKDAGGTSACTGGCLNNWPIFYMEDPSIEEELNADDFASIDRGEGVMQTTYKGWPLYYFANDANPGDTNGEGVINSWFVAKPDYTIMLVDNQLVGNDGKNYTGEYMEGDEVIQYFTDDMGVTLYTWINDNYLQNNFTNEDFSNNNIWPIYEEEEVVVPSILDAADFAVVDVFGKKQLAYNGWPLYFFGQDMMMRASTKGVSVPSPGIWPVAVQDMMSETVVDIIVNSEDHTTLEAAVVAAGLVETLQGEGPFTVFAPTDAAFAALPEGTVEALLADIPTLTSILTYHVVGGKAMSTDLSDGQMIATVNGKEITVTINNDGVFINDAKVIVADIEAGNGVVHVIDAVLIPPVDEAAFPIDFETQTDAQWFVFANGDVILSDFMVIENPDKSGINTSDNVLQFVVNDNADTYAGAVSESYAPVEFTLSSHKITMMVWKSVISPVGFKLEASTNGGPVTELKVPNTLTNQWEMLTFDFSSLIGYSYEKIVIFPDFPATRTEGTTVYIDNIERKQSSVVDIVAGSIDHNTLEAAVVAAGLVETLQGEGPFTVFAPTDAAFAALPEGTVEALLADIPALTDILTYHVVAGKAMSTDLSDGQVIATLNGKEIKVTINNDGVFINDAQVIIADIEAENGVVHVIDAVLLPPTNVLNTLTSGDFFKVYPNPADGYVTFELDMDKASVGSTLEIIRIDGVLANKVPITNFVTTLDLSGYKSGVYYLRYSSGDKYTIKKLVIK